MEARERINRLYEASLRQSIRRHALSLTKDPYLMEDLIQDTLLHAIERIDKFDGANPVAYLGTLMHNLFVNQYRRSQKMSLTDIEEYQNVRVTYIEQSADAQLLEDVIKNHLTPKAQLIFRLISTGYNLVQAAKELGMAEGTVRTTLYRSNRIVAKHLKALGYEDNAFVQKWVNRKELVGHATNRPTRKRAA